MFGSNSSEGKSVFQTITNFSQLEKKKNKRKLSSYESGFEGRASIFFSRYSLYCYSYLINIIGQVSFVSCI